MNSSTFADITTEMLAFFKESGKSPDSSFFKKFEESNYFKNSI